MHAENHKSQLPSSGESMAACDGDVWLTNSLLVMVIWLTNSLLVLVTCG